MSSRHVIADDLVAARLPTRWVTVDGHDLAMVAVAPARPTGGPVLLLPGYTGSKEDFTLLLPLLAAAGHPAYAVDLPGQYQSWSPAEPAAYTVAEVAQVVVGLIAALGRGPVNLVGHSFGGMVARAVVLDHAQAGAVRSLTLLSSGPDGASLLPHRHQVMDALRPLALRGDLVAVAQALGRLAELDPGHVPPPPRLGAFLAERFLASSAVGLVGTGDALQGEPDRTDELASHATAIGLPLAVVHGADDDAWPAAVLTETALRLDARHVALDGVGHSPAAEAPAATSTALLPGLV